MVISGKLQGFEKKIEWSIPDFFILAEKNKMLDSPNFFFGNSDVIWYLQIWSRWKKDDFIQLCLFRDEAADYEVECSFGLKKSDLSVVHLGNDVLKKDERFNRRNYNLIEKKELLDKKSELVPGNTLTVICTLKFGTKITHSIQEPTLNETTPPMLSSLDKLSENFKDLFADKESSDVTLKVQDREFKVHKYILMARCSVFAAIFKSDSKKTLITITDCDAKTFQDFLKYLYCGKIEKLSLQNAMNLYYTAHNYDITELKELCTETIKLNLELNSLFEVAAMANKYDDPHLFRIAQDFFNGNTTEIFEMPEWQSLIQNDFRLGNMLLKGMSGNDSLKNDSPQQPQKKRRC